MKVQFDAPLLSQILVEHGPVDLLGRFFLLAVAEAHKRGVTLSFGSFDQLRKTNEENSDTWHPLLPTFIPSLSGISDEDGFCILGRNSEGDIVATQAVRFFNWSDTNFYEEAKSLRLFYSNPTISRLPGEHCKITAKITKTISGRVAFPGAVWYHPDYRGKQLSTILPRIGHACAFTRWATDYTVAFMTKEVIARGMPAKYGYPHTEFNLEFTGTREGDIEVGFIWISTPELLQGLQDFVESRRE